MFITAPLSGKSVLVTFISLNILSSKPSTNFLFLYFFFFIIIFKMKEKNVSIKTGITTFSVKIATKVL